MKDFNPVIDMAIRQEKPTLTTDKIWLRASGQQRVQRVQRKRSAGPAVNELLWNGKIEHGEIVDALIMHGMSEDEAIDWAIHRFCASKEYPRPSRSRSRVYTIKEGWR